MTEPRARPRPKGQQFSTADLENLLFAFGDNTPALPETVRVLDEILTDFIIEACHAAALSASYSRRQKIKVDDFKWVLRKDPELLGRVLEQLWMDKHIKDQRKIDNVTGEGGAAELEKLVELGEEEGGKKRKRVKKTE